MSNEIRPPSLRSGKNNPFVEGWRYNVGEKRFHYFAGIGGMGGKIRSLCFDYLAPVEAKFISHNELTVRNMKTEIPACLECLNKIQEANRHTKAGR
jgi:hypothetical protein